MWCIPKVTPEFIARMEDVLNLYALPYNPREPVLCFDEKSKQLLKDTRPVKHTREGKLRRCDYEYERNGTRNIFLAVEPKAGFRTTSITERRTKTDFAYEIERIISLPHYTDATCIHIVLDNLNTHFEASLIETFGRKKARQTMRRIRFHYTPKHASWLNMAEIEIGILSRQSIRGRIPTQEALITAIRLWEQRRNGVQAMIRWTFTVNDARVKFKYDEGSKLG